MAYQIYMLEIQNDFDLNENYYKLVKNLDISYLRKLNNKNLISKYFKFIKFLRMKCRISELGFYGIYLIFLKN